MSHTPIKVSLYCSLKPTLIKPQEMTDEHYSALTYNTSSGETTSADCKRCLNITHLKCLETQSSLESKVCDYSVCACKF